MDAGMVDQGAPFNHTQMSHGGDPNMNQIQVHCHLWLILGASSLLLQIALLAWLKSQSTVVFVFVTICLIWVFLPFPGGDHSILSGDVQGGCRTSQPNGTSESFWILDSASGPFRTLSGISEFFRTFNSTTEPPHTLNGASEFFYAAISTS